MEKVFFFRNIENYKELIYKDNMKRKFSINNQKYKVIGKVILERTKYEHFLRKINMNWDFLYGYIDEMKIRDNVWRCVLITSEGYEGILVMNDGYQYPRFTALFLDEE